MLKKFLLTGLTAVALSWAAPASALVVKFDPSGTAGATGDVAIESFDPAVGNALAIGANVTNTAGQQLTVLFQANLSTVSTPDVGLGSTNVGFGSALGYIDDNGNVIAGARFVTFVAGFNETVVSSLTSALDPNGPTNFFHIYVNTVAPGNNLTGTCFTCGTLALSGVFQLDPRVSNVSNFVVNGGGPGTPLDGFGVDNYDGVADGGLNPPDTENIDTLTGQGSFNTAIKITSVNSLYFPDLNPGTVLTFLLASSQELLNYQATNPSKCFSSLGTPGTNCDTEGATLASVGAVNLFNGPNSLFQTDASLSFAPEAIVPEPATLSLLGLGLLAGARQRAKSRKQK